MPLPLTQLPSRATAFISHCDEVITTTDAVVLPNAHMHIAAKTAIIGSNNPLNAQPHHCCQPYSYAHMHIAAPAHLRWRSPRRPA